MKTLFSFFSHENRVRGIFEQRLINSKDICLARAKGTSLSLSLSSFDLVIKLLSLDTCFCRVIIIKSVRQKWKLITIFRGLF